MEELGDTLKMALMLLAENGTNDKLEEICAKGKALFGQAISDIQEKHRL